MLLMINTMPSSPRWPGVTTILKHAMQSRVYTEKRPACAREDEEEEERRQSGESF